MTATDPIGDVVVCSLEAWDEVWRRNQWLVSELMTADASSRFLFVEPPLDLVHSAVSGRRPQRPGLRRLDPGGRLWALRPVKPLPRVVAPGLTERALALSVRRTARRLGFDDPLLWVNDCAYSRLAEEVSWPAVYDITDDWLLAADAPRALQRRREEEAVLLRRCEEVVAVSSSLVRTKGAHRRIELVPNAVDVALFQRPQPRPADLPPGPVALYVGTVHEDRVDVGLCARTAERIAPATVTLVGPNHLGAAATAELVGAGCVLLGPRPFGQVPGYYQHAEVILVPHVVTPFTESLNPIKGFEILAVGRPAVTTPVADLRDLGEPVVVADATSFPSVVAALLAEARPSRPQCPPSWSDRAQDFARVLRRARRPEVEPGHGHAGGGHVGDAQAQATDQPGERAGG